MFSKFSIVLLAALPLIAQQPAGAGVNFYSVEKEAALGKQLAADVLRQATVLETPPAQDYLNRLGQRLAAQWPDSKWPFSFSLIANEGGGAAQEPLALPAGYIFVPAGLVLAARDEAEFAGMMAHAMAHVAARDWTRQASRGELFNMSMTAAEQAAAPGRARDAIGQSFGPRIDGLGSLGYAIGPSRLAVPPAFLSIARNSHLAADAMAAQAMARAGFNPEALVRYLERDRPGATAATFSEWPDQGTRLAALRKLIAAMPAAGYAAPAPEFAAFQQEVRRLVAHTPPSLKRDNEK